MFQFFRQSINQSINFQSINFMSIVKLLRGFLSWHCRNIAHMWSVLCLTDKWLVLHYSNQSSHGFNQSYQVLDQFCWHLPPPIVGMPLFKNAPRLWWPSSESYFKWLEIASTKSCQYYKLCFCTISLCDWKTHLEQRGEGGHRYYLVTYNRWKRYVQSCS